MKINIKKLVPKDWIIEDVENSKIKVYYVNKGRGSSPKPFILPREIIIDKFFMEAIGMYLGDGKLSKDDKHLGFSSIDEDMDKFILDFFMNVFGISLNHMTISIRFKDFKQKVLKDWSGALNIPITKLKIQLTQRSKKESCEIQISGKVFRIIFENIINKVKESNFLENKTLRRAFLRGIFAAEGNIAVNYQQNYIVSMRFCLGLHEVELANYIQNALDLEKISHKTFKRESSKSMEIYLTGWKNYYKCWRIDLFHRNLRKEYLFLSKLIKTKFVCKLNDNMRNKLFYNKYMSHRQLSLFIGATESTICRLIRNERESINIEYIIELARLASISLDKIRKNVLEFSVRGTTHIDDPEFIDLVLRLKAYS